MFLNISNHPSAKWGEVQRARAELLGNHIVDMQFPNVPPLATTEDVTEIARRIVAGLPPAYEIDYAMVQGEFSLTYELTRMMLALGWKVCVATTERKVVEEEGGKKTTVFEFVQFRMIRK